MTQEQQLQATLQRIYRAAADTMRELMDTSNMFIALYDEESETITFPLGYENGREVPEDAKRPGHYLAPRRLGERKGLTDWVIRHREPLLIKENFAEWARSQPDIEVFDIGTQCWLGAPMLLRNKVLGVIALQNFQEPRVFDEGHRDLLVTIASQAAVAIANVRSFKAAQDAAVSKKLAEERQVRLHMLQSISDRMAQVVTNPDAVLSLVVQAANDVTRSDLTSVYRYDENMQRFTGGVRQLRGGAIEDVTEDELPESDGEIARVAEKQEAVYEQEAKETSFNRRHRVKSLAALPLVVTTDQGYSRTVGVLVVNFRNEHEFPEDEREILAHLASQAAIAIAYTEARASASANELLALLGSATATLQHRLSNTISITLPAVLRLRYRIGNDPENEGILDTIERNTRLATDVIRRMQVPLRREPFVLTSITSLLNTAILDCIRNVGRFPQARIISNISSGEGQEASPTDGDDRPVIRIEAILAEDIPTTYASIGPLQEVFRVLIENAIKAIYPKSGQVTVESRVREGRRSLIEVIVRDNGRGIEPEVREKLFKQPVPRREFGEGAGLGLWLSNIVVRSHQGRIMLQWTEPGKGSTFLVQLPILNRPPVDVQS